MAFLPLAPGSGFGIRDWKKFGTRTDNSDHISRSLETIFWEKKVKCFVGSVLRIRVEKVQTRIRNWKSRSGNRDRKIPDPELLNTTLFISVLSNSSQQPVFIIRYGTEPYHTVLIHNWFLALPFKIEDHNWHTAHVRAAVLGPGCFEEKRPYLTTIHPSLHNCSHVLVQHRSIGSWKEWLQIRTRDNCDSVPYPMPSNNVSTCV